MRVFISADIEGIATTTLWSETETQTQSVARAHAQQMTAEVKAACEGAIAAGADYILVRDAHDTGTNLDARALPACAELIRGWSGHPYCMVEGKGEDVIFDDNVFALTGEPVTITPVEQDGRTPKPWAGAAARDYTIYDVYHTYD